MSYFRITDLRTRWQSDQFEFYAATLGGGADLTLSLPRATAALQVFNVNRTCFWDDTNKVFATDPTLGDPPMPGNQLADGIVESWDVKIPRNGTAKIYLSVRPRFTAAMPRHETSGGQAVCRVTVEATDDNLPTLVELLCSSYVAYDNQGLQPYPTRLTNTDFHSSFSTPW